MHHAVGAVYLGGIDHPPFQSQEADGVHRSRHRIAKPLQLGSLSRSLSAARDSDDERHSGGAG